MFTIPKRTADRIQTVVPKFQQILASAKARDINESDTVNIITDMLAEVFGFDKYTEITSEFAVRGTYCDLAVRVDGRLQFMVEAKAIGLDLKDAHVRQAASYGASQGVPWVLLTNGNEWRLYRVKFEQPVGLDLVARIDFCSLNSRSDKDQQMLFLLCREGVTKDARGIFYERLQSFNRFVLAALVLSEPVMAVIRRELRRLADGLRVDADDVETMLRSEVIKRDLIESEDATLAQKRLTKMARQAARERKSSTVALIAKGGSPDESLNDSKEDLAP